MNNNAADVASQDNNHPTHRLDPLELLISRNRYLEDVIKASGESKETLEGILTGKIPLYSSICHKIAGAVGREPRVVREAILETRQRVLGISPKLIKNKEDENLNLYQLMAKRGLNCEQLSQKSGVKLSLLLNVLDGKDIGEAGLRKIGRVLECKWMHILLAARKRKHKCRQLRVQSKKDLEKKLRTTGGTGIEKWRMTRKRVSTDIPDYILGKSERNDKCPPGMIPEVLMGVANLNNFLNWNKDLLHTFIDRNLLISKYNDPTVMSEYSPVIDVWHAARALAIANRSGAVIGDGRFFYLEEDIDSKIIHQGNDGPGLRRVLGRLMLGFGFSLPQYVKGFVDYAEAETLGSFRYGLQTPRLEFEEYLAGEGPA